MHAIVNEAEALILADPEMDDDAAANFNELRATAFEDLDYEVLFDAAADGIDDSTDPKADVVTLRFNDWFPTCSLGSGVVERTLGWLCQSRRFSRD